MKLGNIFQSYPAWVSVSQLKLNPQTAYKILKYFRLLSAEHELIEKHRVSLIYEITGADINSRVELTPDTAEFKEYVSKFGAFLQTDSDLVKLDMSLEDFITNLDPSNKLSTNDLVLLEPFFKE